MFALTTQKHSRRQERKSSNTLCRRGRMGGNCSATLKVKGTLLGVRQLPTSRTAFGFTHLAISKATMPPKETPTRTQPFLSFSCLAQRRAYWGSISFFWGVSHGGLMESLKTDCCG